MREHTRFGRAPLLGTWGRRAAAVAAALGLTVAAASSATASQPSIQHYHGEVTFIQQDIGSCLEVPFPLQTHESLYDARIVDFTGAGGLQRESFSLVVLATYTNLETGVSFTWTHTIRDAAVRVTDNGDGTLSILFAGIDNSVVRAPDGGVFGVNAGRVTVSVLVDDNGTPADWDDDVLISEEFGDHVGMWSLGGLDDCAIALALLG